MDLDETMETVCEVMECLRECVGRGRVEVRAVLPGLVILFDETTES